MLMTMTMLGTGFFPPLFLHIFSTLFSPYCPPLLVYDGDMDVLDLDGGQDGEKTVKKRSMC